MGSGVAQRPEFNEATSLEWWVTELWATGPAAAVPRPQHDLPSIIPRCSNWTTPGGFHLINADDKHNTLSCATYSWETTWLTASPLRDYPDAARRRVGGNGTRTRRPTMAPGRLAPAWSPRTTNRGIPLPASAGDHSPLGFDLAAAQGQGSDFRVQDIAGGGPPAGNRWWTCRHPGRRSGRRRRHLWPTTCGGCSATSRPRTQPCGCAAPLWRSAEGRLRSAPCSPRRGTGGR